MSQSLEAHSMEHGMADVISLEKFQSPQPEGSFISVNGDKSRPPSHLIQGAVAVGDEKVDWTLEIPEDLRYDGLAEFVPGYLGIKQSSRKPRNALSDNGIAALSYSPARNGGESRLASFKDPQELHVRTLGAIATDLRDRSAEISSKVPNGNKVNLDKKLLVLHSMGGLAGPRYAVQEMDAVHQIHGYATVGFGHPALAELALDLPKGMAGSIKHELLPAFKNGALEINLRNVRDIVKYYARLRVIFEGLSCLNGDVTDEVSKLADNGIPYYYHGFGKDILVRPVPAIADFVTSFSVMEQYGHLAPQVKSGKTAAKVTELALAA